jgi:hypothetical protein
MYELTQQDLLDIQKRFSYHPPKDDQAERYNRIRAEILATAMFIMENTPKSREQSLALTNLEQVLFWSNASIARNE